ncbi:MULTISPECIES: ABC transporter permease [Micrococcales]|uniref:ABC transporter permease n=1 Tax=Micrococcales TaxID=85006 RepID=UPI00190930BC|nr:MULTISPECIES: ABC transporter permease [Micrococcales]GLU58311.1 ABC transporter permease [Paenarthrobacter ureafaciens]GLU62979.1 ABC transporter permease [Paenarthrobacter ureafaciens]GLU67253.1 ABC transporter permease [Paenarthrobacter ureafaciens]GLU71165.1 ABC transporter permease [Paenarthrobacter ureafaciens]GLU75786.1 ABC transporter permease [Paenarthrobacter ureafaciens]
MTTQILSIPDSSKSRVRTGAASVGGLALPALLALGVFFVYPLALIVWLSFTSPEVGLGHYISLFTDGVTVTVMLRTLAVGLIVGLATLVIGYPYAYSMTVVSPGWRTVMMTMVMLPFWVNIIARTFAWFILENRGGLIDQLFQAFGIEGVVLLNTWGGVAVAMVQVMLPFMVLPLYNQMSTIDRGLLRAAASLGAKPAASFAKVYFPLSLTGVMSGFSLVFVVTLGFYITPALLGSPDQALLSQIIATRVQRLLDFPGAGAAGMLLLVVTLVILGVLNWIVRRANPLMKKGSA